MESKKIWQSNSEVAHHTWNMSPYYLAKYRTSFHFQFVGLKIVKSFTAIKILEHSNTDPMNTAHKHRRSPAFSIFIWKLLD